MELDEQRLKQAAESLSRTGVTISSPTWTEEDVREVVEAYNADPKPQWPTQEMIDQFDWADSLGSEEAARLALVAASRVDPIHRAAVEVVRAIEGRNDWDGWRKLMAAVRDAGLLDEEA